MIYILWKDKNGKELSNGDTIRYFKITPEMQEEYGDNIPRPGGYYEHQVGTHLEWVEVVFDVDEQMQEHEEGECKGFFDLPTGHNYDKETICELFDLSDDLFDVALLNICEFIGMDEDTESEEVFKKINGFEIIKSAASKLK